MPRDIRSATVGSFLATSEPIEEYGRPIERSFGRARVSVRGPRLRCLKSKKPPKVLELMRRRELLSRKPPGWFASGRATWSSGERGRS